MKLTTLAQSPKTRVPPQHVLVYGPPFTGKTTLFAELSKEFNLLYIGLENGHTVFYALPVDQQERVEIVRIPDTRSFPIAIETVLKIVKGGKHEICDIHGKISCPICKANALKVVSGDPITFTTVELNALDSSWIVGIDSLTQLTNSGIAHITKGQPDDYKLQHDDWGNLGKLMDVFFSHIQQAPYHVVCISHESEAEMEDGKTKIVPVAGTRNFSRNVAKYFDHVIYAQVSNAKHTFTSVTTQTLNIVAGSRTGFDIKNVGSLLPIFKGEFGPPPQTNGQKAAGGLSNLLKSK